MYIVLVYVVEAARGVEAMALSLALASWGVGSGDAQAQLRLLNYNASWRYFTNGTDLGTFQPTGRILVNGLAGDDDIQVSGSISVPIWLIIVLLSPLDAYEAVKNLARQV